MCRMLSAKPITSETGGLLSVFFGSFLCRDKEMNALGGVQQNAKKITLTQKKLWPV